MSVSAADFDPFTVEIIYQIHSTLRAIREEERKREKMRAGR